MKLMTGIRALQKLFRKKDEKAGPTKNGRTEGLIEVRLSQADEPDIMYLEDTPAIYANSHMQAAAKNAEEKQINETGDHRFHGNHHSHRMTLRKRLSAFFNMSEESDSQKNHSRQRHHQLRLMAAYAAAGIALITALLVFVLPEGGNAATELIIQQPVKLIDNPRIEKINIDPLLLSEHTEPAVSPDAPTVTSALFDDSEHADAAAMLIDAANTAPTPIPTAVPEPIPSPVAVDELVEFFVDHSETDYEEAGYSTNSYEYTDEEFYLLAQIIDIEARGEPFEGMVAVGNVVMNRVLNTDTFGDTITRVVKSGQFAYSGNSHRQPSLAAKRAAEVVLDDEYWVLPQNVYFFKSHSKPGKDWGRNQYYTTIKGHCFYLYAYNGRYNGDGIPPKLFERSYKYARYGCKSGERVRRISQMLNAIGFNVYEDGRFDMEMHKALVLFQQKNGLDANGIASPDTITALIKAYGFENYIAEYVSDTDAA